MPQLQNEGFCHRCGETVGANRLENVDVVWLCSECRAEITAYCGVCNAPMMTLRAQRVVIETANQRTRNYVCADCQNTLQRCNNCDCYYTPGEQSNNRYCYCAACAEEYLRTCIACEQLTITRDLNSRGICRDCRCIIHDYSYRPAPLFEGKPPYYGIEVEMESTDAGRNMEELAQMLPARQFYAKFDGSLTRGFEAVSHPLSFRKWKELDLSPFARLARDGCRSGMTHTCGMHVHTDRASWKALRLYKLLQFFNNNEEFLLWFSLRRRSRLDQWAPFTYRNAVRKAKEPHEDRRYAALNLQPQHTLEFRLFKGTLKPSGIMRNIEFCHCLYDWTGNTTYKDLTAQAFESFVIDSHRTYPNLAKFLERGPSRTAQRMAR